MNDVDSTKLSISQLEVLIDEVKPENLDDFLRGGGWDIYSYFETIVSSDLPFLETFAE